jgi:carotenoid cleavage dioxygenase
VIVEGIRTGSFPKVPGPDVLASGEPFYPAPILTRFELDPRTGKATQETVSRTPCELPTIDPREVSRPHTQAFAMAGPALAEGDTHVAPFFSRIVRFDRSSGQETVRDLGHALVGEPVYVPGRGDGEGVVLTVVFEGAREKSALYVLAAKTLETRAICDLPHGLPAGFHGTWVPAAGDA